MQNTTKFQKIEILRSMFLWQHCSYVRNFKKAKELLPERAEVPEIENKHKIERRNKKIIGLSEEY